MAKQSFFTRFSHTVSAAAGKPITFAIACVGILLWAISGPLFGYSETWQLLVNTSTTIITFLMVFILQNTQNRDGEAIQAKLDELILSSAAQNKFVGAENLSDKELQRLRALVTKAALADADDDEAPKTVTPKTVTPRTVTPRTVTPRTVTPRTVADRSSAPRRSARRAPAAKVG